MKKAPQSKVILGFAAVYVIWGTTYLAIKFGISEIPPFLMASLRYSIAATVLTAISVILKKELTKVPILRNMLLGGFMLSLGQGILFWAELHLSSGLTAVLVSTLPICYIIVDRTNWKNYFHSKVTLLGIVLGLAGVALLFSEQLGSNSEGEKMTLIASLAVIGSCLCWAWGSIYYKNHTCGPLMPEVSWQLVGGAIACLVVSASTEPLTSVDIFSFSLRAWGSVVYLAIAGSVIAFTASYYLLSVRPPAVVGTYAYVNPIIAVLLGVLIAGEHVSTIQGIGIAVILIAAYLSNRAKFKAK
ncbi:EamA family transporter [Pedobacter sp. Du54]|uniref:EamA family transporter n=1 Tax=Pedobacter anseongensis TaxID=3133439 RepID=UPI0030A11CE0